MKPLRFAVFGAGFWSQFQLAAWHELEGVQLVAIGDPDVDKAKKLAARFGFPNVYASPEELLEREELDFVDIISSVETHAELVKLVASHGTAVVCQKPMAASFREAKEMVEHCARNNAPFFVHENFRWQAPLRALKKAIDSGIIGRPFKARVSFCSAFPVFENQPSLAEVEHFIIADVGSHVLDICRFLFGEVRSLSCVTQRVNSKIKGEDVANVLMEMESGLHCYSEMSYASLLEKEAFPQTLVLVEGEKGSIHLTNDFELRTTTAGGTSARVISPTMYNWVDPAYATVHSSIVDCNRDILGGLRGGTCETVAEDNLRTMQLVWACYEAASHAKTITVK